MSTILSLFVLSSPLAIPNGTHPLDAVQTLEATARQEAAAFDKVYGAARLPAQDPDVQWAIPALVKEQTIEELNIPLTR